MIRFGIVSLAQLEKKASKGPVKASVGCDLYAQIPAVIENPQDVQRLQSEVLRRLRFPNGTYKRTHASRFDEFDGQILDTLRTRFPGDELRLLDLGVSDATTSVDLWKHLEDGLEIPIDYLATDKYMEIEVRSHRSLPLQFVADSQGEVIQVRRGGFVFNRFRPESWVRFPLNRMLLDFWVPRLISLHNSGVGDQFTSKNMRLISDTALEIERQQAGFRTDECDLFDLPSGPFDVIRAMNILNPDYFTRKQLDKALDCVHRSLSHEGFFAIGANGEAGSQVDGALYKKINGRFELVFQADAECRIHDVIMDFFSGVD